MIKKEDIGSEKQKALDFKGSVLVTANPGTGKTFLLANKYVNLVKQGVLPEEILCLTFTNKAKREMEKRIIEQLKEAKSEVDLSKLNVYTFHSFALDYLDEGNIISTNLLRFVIYEYLKEKEVFSYGDAYLISDIVPRMENLMRYLKSYGITPEKISYDKTKKLLEEFERSSDLIEKEDLEKFLGYFIEIFGLYEKEKARKGIDYADLLINFLALKNKPKFKFVLVDELQDVNELEARIALGSAKTFFAVGDKKQAIFGFQGGSIGNFKLFTEKKPLKQNLTLNRRSTQQILDFSAEYFKSKTIDEESKKELDGLKSFNDSKGIKPKIIEAGREEIIGKVCALINKIESNDLAIIVRTNSQIMEIA
ncbi:ATP-dependent helicase, partial [Candidatus Micrarchaeota archaeon]|nr:ATP-dependent helicase [Candidatus Micrarchaeota archaeon]